jgi:hypothetical protein
MSAHNDVAAKKCIEKGNRNILDGGKYSPETQSQRIVCYDH